MSNRENDSVAEQWKKASVLKSAAYIAKSLSEGKNEEQIIKEFGGDKQLVDMLRSFAHHNGWITKDIGGDYTLTNKGKERLSRLVESFFGFSVLSVLYGPTMSELEYLSLLLAGVVV